VDASLDWLEEMPETEEAVEELAEQELEEVVEEVSAVELPDNLDDAMVWLDALAEEQDASVEALSAVTDEIVIDETAVPDASELDAELAFDESFDDPFDESFDDLPADLDDAMGWLEDLAAEQNTPLEDLPTIAGVVDEALFVEPPAAAEPEPEAPTDELTEALDWLEQLALKDSDSIPRETVKIPVEETAVSGTEDDLAAALDWLEQLAQPEKTAEKPAAGLVDLADLSDDMPDDPDEALAWLQQVAAEQEEIDVTELASTDEDEFVVDLFEVPEAAETVEPEAEMAVEPAAAPDDEPTEAENEDDILAEMPDDPEAMMAWLERLAARQGARLEELPSVTAADMLVWAGKPAPEIEEPVDVAESLAAVFPDEIDELPEDEADAAWLDDLMDMGEETAVATADDDSPGLVELEDVAVSEADLTELEVPEDMDDAMAWLEALAAQQGAKLEELPTLSGTGKLAVESLDEVDEIGETAVAPDSQEIPTDAVEAAPDFSGADETSLIPDDEPAEDISYLSEGIEEALPDWLDVDTDSLEEMPGQTQWLRDLDEPDIEGWLNEEETTISDLYDDSVLSRSEPLSDSIFEAGSLSSSATAVSDSDLFDMSEDEIETTVFSLDDEKLAAARQAVESGMFDEALDAYQTLVDAGGGMMPLIADLETVAVDHPEQPIFRHLLGDAYMRNGQLQKALDTYRVALDQI
jgi:tetratricopeptide (TPR) repeat protein